MRNCKNIYTATKAKKRNMAFLLLATTALIGLTSMPTSAQEAKSSDQASNDLEEIRVTARRRFRPETSSAASKLELSIVETPQALTVISSEFLDVAKLRDTADLVAYTAGVEHAGTADGTEAVLVARGFPIDRERSYRVNGLSVDSEVDFDYYAMDRVEVVRGPASSLYGEADYGATLNRILKSPSPKFEVSGGVEFGTHSHNRLEGDIQGALNDSGTISGRMVMSLQDNHGFIKDTENNHWMVAPSISLDLEKTHIDLQVYYSRVFGSSSDGFPLLWDTDGQGKRTYRLPDYDDIPRDANYGASYNDIDSDNGFYFANIEHHFSDSLKGKVDASYSRVNMNNLSTYLFGLAGDGTSGLYASFEDKTKKNISVEASLEKSFTMFGQEQRVLISGDWRKNERWQPSWNFSTLATFNFLDVPGPYQLSTPDPIFVDGDSYSADQKFYGASLLAYLKASSRLSFLLGMRYAGIDSVTTTDRPSVGQFTQAVGKDHAWVPRAGLVYNIAGSHHIYLSYSEGIIFNEAALNASGEPIDPEQGVQYEAGIKGEIFDKRLFYSVSAFRIKRSNVATVIDPNPGGIAISGNIGSQVHKGFEAEVVGEPVPGLNIVASYAYLDVKVKESARPAEVGQRPAAAPKNSFSLFATYELLKGPLKSLTFGGGVVARSSREVDNVGSFSLPSYKRIDLRASYDLTDNILLEFNIRNLLNERIFTTQYGSPLLGIAYSDPFKAIAGISFRY